MVVFIIVILLVALAWLLISNEKHINNIVNCFSRSNVIVVGKKGRGKDSFFQMIIDRRKKPCYANIDYGKYSEVKPLGDLNINPNTYEKIIADDITVIDKTQDENKDYYLSDGGIYLPSHFDSTLSKTYPTLPSYYALSRHLTNSNIHVNVQNIDRLWKKIREQADDYFKMLNCIYIGRLCIMSVRYYEEYNALVSGVRPFKCGLLASAERQALKADFDSKNGLVKDMIIFYIMPKQHYATRHFHKVLYGENAPKI